MNTGLPSLHQLKIEAAGQSRLYGNLKKWLVCAASTAGCFLILIMYGPRIHPAMTIGGWIGMVLSVLAMLMIGLALYHGRQNLEQILSLIEKQENTAIPAHH